VRIGKIVGQIVTSLQYPTLSGGRFVLIEVMDRFALAGKPRDKPGEIVASYDLLGVGVGDLVAFTESGEAAAPFLPEKKVPLDALTTAILDQVSVRLDSLNS